MNASKQAFTPPALWEELHTGRMREWVCWVSRSQSVHEDGIGLPLEKACFSFSGCLKEISVRLSLLYHTHDGNTKGEGGCVPSSCGALGGFHEVSEQREPS